MRVLIGECTGRLAIQAESLGWGRVWVARGRNIYVYEGEPWLFDNGAFRDWAEGVPFDSDLFRRIIDKVLAVPHPPYLAVIPDAPGNATKTLEMYEEWRPQLPDLQWCIAVQDGMEPADIEGYSGEIAGVFLGGTNKYKASAGEWCDWAHEKGLYFHYGRCGTLHKLAHAIEVGADSIDSAFPMWTTARWNLWVESVTNGPIQQGLFS